MRVLVVGIGAIGGTLAVRLVQAGHDVVGVARGAHFDTVRRDGLRLQTPDEDVTVPLPVVPDVGEVAAADVVLLTVKGQDTAPVAEAIGAGPLRDVPVVCAQNGVANEDVVRRSCRSVYGGLVMMPAAHLRPGEVQAFSTPTVGMVDVGRWPSGSDGTAEGVARMFRAARVDSRAVPDIGRWKYTKLLMNLGNAVIALCGESGRGSEVLHRADAEGRAVLDAAGIAYASAEEDRTRRGDTLRVGAISGEDRPGNSTWQSLARSTGSSEVDLLNGEVVRIGARVGVPTPVNAALTRLVEEAASAGTPPGAMTPDAVLAVADR